MDNVAYPSEDRRVPSLEAVDYVRAETHRWTPQLMALRDAYWRSEIDPVQLEVELFRIRMS